MPIFTKCGHKSSAEAKSSGQAAAKAKSGPNAKAIIAQANKYCVDSTRWQVSVAYAI